MVSLASLADAVEWDEDEDEDEDEPARCSEFLALANNELARPLRRFLSPPLDVPSSVDVRPAVVVAVVDDAVISVRLWRFSLLVVGEEDMSSE